MQTDVIKTEISDAIGAHGKWKLKLRTAASQGEVGLPVNDISRDDMCKFGKWLNTVKPDGQNAEYLKSARGAHSRFHSAAGNIAAMISRGEADAAKAALDAGAFKETSVELTRVLTAWRRTL